MLASGSNRSGITPWLSWEILLTALRKKKNQGKKEMGILGILSPFLQEEHAPLIPSTKQVVLSGENQHCTQARSVYSRIKSQPVYGPTIKLPVGELG